MKKSMVWIRRVMGLAMGLILLALAGGLLAVINTDEIGSGEMSNPLFATPALAAETRTFLDQEAGLALWMDAGQTLDLAEARKAYKSAPEKEGSDYIVGSLSLPNLQEEDDVHAYVTRDGWVVVYYGKSSPVSKVVDWTSYQGDQFTSNKLVAGMAKICAAVGLSPANGSYCHFQFPQATSWMIITDSQTGDGADSFNVNIPSSLTTYERSWSFRAGAGTAATCGFLKESQLTPDQSHVIAANVGVTASGNHHAGFSIDGVTISDRENASTSEIAIVLIYRES